jgi:hypothetical protein
MKRQFWAGLLGGIVGFLIMFVLMNVTGVASAWTTGRQDQSINPDISTGIDMDAQFLPLGTGPAGTPLGSEITYQGQLKVNGIPFTGTCDMYFELWDGNPPDVMQKVKTSSTMVVTVTDGLFTKLVDFPLNSFDLPVPFDGSNRTIAPYVRCPSGSGTFSAIGGQTVTAVPYAMSLKPGAVITSNQLIPYTAGTFSVENTGANSAPAIRGTSEYGVGVFAYTHDDINAALLAYNPHGNAINIGGGIQIFGAGLDTDTPVFIHQVSTSNRCTNIPYATIIDNALINGDPNAFVFVTYRDFGGDPPRDPVGVFYKDYDICGNGLSANRWVIYSLGTAGTALINEQTFNVLVMEP